MYRFTIKGFDKVRGFKARLTVRADSNKEAKQIALTYVSGPRIVKKELWGTPNE